MQPVLMSAPPGGWRQQTHGAASCSTSGACHTQNIRLAARAPVLGSSAQAGLRHHASSRCAAPVRPVASPLVARAVERDLDWEPDLKAPGAAPSRSGAGGPNSYSPPQPPPPPGTINLPDGPFKSRRDIALTLLGGAAGLWLLEHKVIAPIDSFGDKPPINFTLAGYTDLAPEDFVYFKTPGGRWVAAAEDEAGRFLMIDEIGDLYYDSGDPQIGLYAMDTQGNLFNFYRDVDGVQKVTPVGNVSDLERFNIREIAGVRLDRDVNVVAFRDGSSVPLPPGSAYVDPLTGRVKGPDQLIEGLNGMVVEKEGPGSPLDFFRGGRGTEAVQAPLQRYEVDLRDGRGFDEQMYEQSFLAQPDGGALLPEDFDIDALARQVVEEAKP